MVSSAAVREWGAGGVGESEGACGWMGRGEEGPRFSSEGEMECIRRFESKNPINFCGLNLRPIFCHISGFFELFDILSPLSQRGRFGIVNTFGYLGMNIHRSNRKEPYWDSKYNGCKNMAIRNFSNNIPLEIHAQH